MCSEANWLISPTPRLQIPSEGDEDVARIDR